MSDVGSLLLLAVGLVLAVLAGLFLFQSLGGAVAETPALEHGLDESTRRAIFKAETVCEDAASWEAYKRYSAWCSRCQQFIKDDERLMFAYIDTYEADCKARLVQQYGITSDVLGAILVEGLEKNWPMSTPIPPPACCE